MMSIRRTNTTIKMKNFTTITTESIKNIVDSKKATQSIETLDQLIADKNYTLLITEYERFGGSGSEVYNMTGQQVMDTLVKARLSDYDQDDIDELIEEHGSILAAIENWFAYTNGEGDDHYQIFELK
jgi:hypothetical protein